MTPKEKRRGRQIETELWLPRPLGDVFAFFADARNLEALTPPWLQFQILTTDPVEMRVGTRIDYRLRLYGVPLRWQSEITAWEPPYRFVDEQRRGPYRFWIHEHTFAERDGGTVVRDNVRYAAPFGFLSHPLLVNRDVRKIFEFREERLQELFGLAATRGSAA